MYYFRTRNRPDGACYNVGMKTTALVIALALGCATPLAHAPEEALPRRAEMWTLVWSPEAEKALEARPEQEKQISVGMLVRVYKLPAMPALDGEVVRARALAKVAALFGPYNFSAKWGERGTGNHALVGGDAPKERWLGNAGRIDHRNKHGDDTVGTWLASLIEKMRFDPARGEKFDLLPTSEQVGDALGVLIAHEIGHGLGLRHPAVEQEKDLAHVMVQGIDKYSLRYLYFVRWCEVHKVYLEAILGKRR